LPRLVWLTTSPRVATGLLSWPAWLVLQEARVLCGDADHPLLPFLAEAGVAVEQVGQVGQGSQGSQGDQGDPLQPGPEQLAGWLLAAAANESVVWVAAPDGDLDLGDALARAVAGAAESGQELPELEVQPGSYDLPGARTLDLVALVDRLRSPGGCPWDARQTHASLLPYLLEEAYETVEAVEDGDDTSLREELGDLLLQVVFHARIAQERAAEAWSLDDVADGVVSKMRSRHPHVFADASAPTAEHVEARWEELKAAEKGRTSAVEGVPLAQPALALAAKLLSRAARAGLDVPVPPAGLETEPGDSQALGGQLLGLVAMARSHGWDAEAALRAAARRYRDALVAAEHRPTPPPAPPPSIT